MCMRAFSIRLPDDLAALLDAVAEQECRSLNQQCEYLIRRALASYQVQGPLQVGTAPGHSATDTQPSQPVRVPRKAGRKSAR